MSRTLVANRRSPLARVLQTLTANLSTGKVQRVIHNGQPFLVASATILKEGVLNGSKGALFYPRKEIAKDINQWDGVPLTLYHPMSPMGEHLSANAQGVKERQWIGFVKKPVLNEKLQIKAYFDETKLKKMATSNTEARKVLNALAKAEPLELSTGLYTDNEEVTGNYQNKPFDYIARNYSADHVAVLPTQVGACSVKDGCGILVNSKTRTKTVSKLTTNFWSDEAREASAIARRSSMKAGKASQKAHDTGRSEDHWRAVKAHSDAFLHHDMARAAHKQAGQQSKADYHQNQMDLHSAAKFHHQMAMTKSIGKSMTPRERTAADQHGAEARARYSSRISSNERVNNGGPGSGPHPGQAIKHAFQKAADTLAPNPSAHAHHLTALAQMASTVAHHGGYREDHQTALDAHVRAQAAHEKAAGTFPKGSTEQRLHSSMAKQHGAAQEMHRGEMTGNSKFTRIITNTYLKRWPLLRQAIHPKSDFAGPFPVANQADVDAVAYLIENGGPGSGPHPGGGSLQHVTQSLKAAGIKHKIVQSFGSRIPRIELAKSAGSSHLDRANNAIKALEKTGWQKGEKTHYEGGADQKMTHPEGGSLSVSHTWKLGGGSGIFVHNRDIPQSTRDKMSDKDFAGSGTSFPIQKPTDVSAALHSIGRTDQNHAAIKSRIKSIAKRKGFALPDSLKANNEEAIVEGKKVYRGTPRDTDENNPDLIEGEAVKSPDTLNSLQRKLIANAGGSSIGPGKADDDEPADTSDSDEADYDEEEQSPSAEDNSDASEQDEETKEGVQNEDEEEGESVANAYGDEYDEDDDDDEDEDVCPKCGGEMVDGECEDCGYTLEDNCDDDMSRNEEGQTNLKSDRSSTQTGGGDPQLGEPTNAPANDGRGKAKVEREDPADLEDGDSLYDQDTRDSQEDFEQKGTSVNPTTNEWSDAAREAATASKKANSASSAADKHNQMMRGKYDSPEKVSQADHQKAVVLHNRAAELNNQAAEQHHAMADRGGHWGAEQSYHFNKALAHESTAQSHKNDAELHSSYIKPTGNQSRRSRKESNMQKLTKQERALLTEQLVANCDCQNENEREAVQNELYELSDGAFNLVANSYAIVTNAQTTTGDPTAVLPAMRPGGDTGSYPKNGVKDGKSEKVDSDDQHDPAALVTRGPGKVPPVKDGSSVMGGGQDLKANTAKKWGSYQEWEQAQHPEARVYLRQAKTIVDNEKKSLVKQLVGNAQGDQAKALEAIYGKMDNDQLKLLVANQQAQVQEPVANRRRNFAPSGLPEGMPQFQSYLGAAGGPEMTANRDTIPMKPEDKQVGMLMPPTMNYAEWIKEDHPHSKPGRALIPGQRTA